MLYELEDIRNFMKQKYIRDRGNREIRPEILFHFDPINIFKFDHLPLGIFEINKKDPFHWIIRMWGPFESIYKNGVFSITINFPYDYPNSAPKVIFNTKIFHLQVHPSCQHICARFINEWKRETSIIELLVGIYLFFTEYQNPNSPFNEHDARLYKENIKAFNEKAKEWVKLYAKPSEADLALTSKIYEMLD